MPSAAEILTRAAPFLLLVGTVRAQPPPEGRAATTLSPSIRTPSPPLWFEDVTASAGVTGELRYLGGAGGAFLDYDTDGWQDILLVGGDAAPTLYRNLGDGSFADVTAAAGLDRPAEYLEWYMSATVGDYDNDGDPDIYLGIWGPNVLFRNEGDGTFTDATTPLLAGNQYTTAAAFADFDADGWLDLYVGNYIEAFDFPFHTGEPNVLLHNRGDGTFSDVTVECGVGGTGTTLAVSWSDFDGDRDPDLWVGNDYGAFVESNLLYRNDGPGPEGGWLFSEVSASLDADARIYCMGVAAGDFDRDLDLDYYFSNLGRNVLLRNDGASGFADVTAETGTENTFDETTVGPALATSWGIGFVDFDLDGWLDLYVSNGHVPLGCNLASHFCRNILNGALTPNVLFHHDGPSLTFSEVGQAAGIDDQGKGRGAAFADFDNDGAIDILQINDGGQVLLYRNVSPPRGHWLKVLPRGRTSARDAVGAQVRVDLAETSLIREINRNYSYQSSSELAVGFGLGWEPEIHRLEVSWPSGITQELFHVGADQAVSVIEPVVTIGSDSGVSGVVFPGDNAQITLELVNESQEPREVSYLLQVRLFGELLGTSPVLGTTVPGAGTLLLAHSVAVPVDAGGLPFEILWSVSDADLGVDQFRFGLTVSSKPVPRHLDASGLVRSRR